MWQTCLSNPNFIQTNSINHVNVCIHVGQWWDDLIKQSSRKGAMDGKNVHINKTKIHHAGKMIKGAFIELYKGLGYLKTYRYPSDEMPLQIHICA